MLSPPLVDETTQRIIAWAMKRPPIRAVLLTSTRAVVGAELDILSDYDVILVVQDIHPFVDDRSWLNDFGEVLIAYWDPIHPDPDFGIDMCANVIQYTDGLKIDFNLWPVSLLEQILTARRLPLELDAGFRVLMDKDHLSDRLPPPTGKAYVPTPPTLTAYQTTINDFLSDAPYVARCLWRDELLPAKWCLDYDMKHIYLKQMLEWRLELDHDWSLPVGNLGKGLKKRLPASLWSEFEKTFVGAITADNWVALFKTMELFRQVAIQVGDQLGYVYPDELHQRVITYVMHIKAMAPKKGEDTTD